MFGNSLYAERLKRPDEEFEDADWMMPGKSFRLRFMADDFDFSLIKPHFTGIIRQIGVPLASINSNDAIEGRFKVTDNSDPENIRGTFHTDNTIEEEDSEAGEFAITYETSVSEEEPQVQNVQQEQSNLNQTIQLPGKEDRTDISLYQDFGNRKTDKRYEKYHWDEVVAEFAKTNPIGKEGLSQKTFNQWVRKNLIAGWTFDQVPAPCIFDVKLVGYKNGLPIIEAYSYNEAFASVGVLAGLKADTGQNFYWQRKISGNTHLSGYGYSTNEQFENYQNIFGLIKTKQDETDLFSNLLLITGDQASYDKMMKDPYLSDRLLSAEFLEMTKQAQVVYNEELTRHARENAPAPKMNDEGMLEIQPTFVPTVPLDGVMDISMYVWVSQYKMLSDYSRQWRSELAQQQAQFQNDLMTPEEKQHLADSKDLEAIVTRLFGLNDVYSMYLDYLKKQAAAAPRKQYNYAHLHNGRTETGTYYPDQTEYQKASAELESTLKASGFAGGIAEFEKCLADFDKDFRSEALFMTEELLSNYETFLLQQDKLYDDDAVVKDLFQKLAGFRTAYAAFVPEQNTVNTAASNWMDYNARGNAPAAKQKAEASMANAQAELANLSDEHPIFKEENLSLNSKVDKKALAEASTPAELKVVLKKQIDARFSDILDMREKLKSKPDLVFKLSDVVDKIKEKYAISSGSVGDIIINTKISDMEADEVAVNIMLGLLAIIFTVMTAGTGAVAVIGVLGTVGVNSYFVYQAYQDYTFKQAAAGSGLSTQDASPFWLIVAVAGAVADLSLVAKALGEISPLLKTFTKADDITRFRNGLAQLKVQSKITARIADAVSIAADIQKGSLEASEALSKAFATDGAGALLKADTYNQLVKYAYYEFRNGVNTFEQYLLKVKNLRSEAKLNADLTKEEIAQLKKAYNQGRTFEEDADLLKYMRGEEKLIKPTKADLDSAELAWVENFLANRPAPQVGVYKSYESGALSTNAMRVLSDELGGMEVAQVFVKQTDGGFYQIFYGSPGHIVIPQFESGTPYLLSHIHPSGTVLPSSEDIDLLVQLQDIQRANGMPVQTSSQIIPIELPNAKFDINSETR